MFHILREREFFFNILSPSNWLDPLSFHIEVFMCSRFLICPQGKISCLPWLVLCKTGRRATLFFSLATEDTRWKLKTFTKRLLKTMNLTEGICDKQVPDEPLYFVKIKSSSTRNAAPFKRPRGKMITVQKLVHPNILFLQLMSTWGTLFQERKLCHNCN